jgi:hypothetical protein
MEGLRGGQWGVGRVCMCVIVIYNIQLLRQM